MGRRSPLRYIAAGAIGVCLLGGTAVAAWNGAAETPQSQHQTTESRKSSPQRSSESVAPDQNYQAPAELPETLNYSSPADLAVSVSYPLFEDGEVGDPRAYTGGGPIDSTLASENYKELKRSAYAVAVDAGSKAPPWPGESYANCAAFTGAVIAHTVDPLFPGNFVNAQREYLREKGNGWIRIGDSHHYDEDSLRPGDLFLSEEGIKAAHTWVWIGEYGGKRDVIAQASYGEEGDPTARLPVLQVNPLKHHGGTVDGLNRSYEIWRFVGADE